MASKTPRSPVVDDLAEEIRRLVLRGEIPLGSRIQQDQLAREFGVSRTPVREALQKLQGTGLVEFIPNRGAFVKGVSSRQIRETYEVRAALEGLAAARAAERIEPGELAELKAAQAAHLAGIEELSAAPVDGATSPDDAWFKADLLFHDTIAEISGNQRLTEELATFRGTFPAGLVRPAARDTPRIIARSVNEHAAVVEALEKGDPDAARHAMESHMLRSSERVVEWFERSTDGPVLRAANGQ
jgi:DNA-binding GntR family transcriptional regulator